MMGRRALFAALLATCAAAGHGRRVLRQEDFAAGTLVIDAPGEYELGEDVVFRPPGQFDAAQPELWMFPDVSQPPFDASPFRLGFFAALIIAADDVTLDLGGHTLSQSPEHALMQRFFSLIELSNSPFPPAAGPADFVGASGFVAANNVVIKNGKLGLSAHHAIHGNNNAGVTLKDLDIFDFEVAGISLNAVSDLEVRDVNVHDSRTDVPAHGSLSQAVFLLQAVDKYLELDTTPAFGAARIVEAQASLRSEVADFIKNGANAAPSAVRLFGSRAAGLPDASLVAGIIVHPRVNVGAVQEVVPENPATDIRFRRVRVHGLTVSPGETGTLFTNDAVKPTHVHDIVGAVFDVDVLVRRTSDFRYESNTLAELQLAIAEYANACLAEASGCTSAADPRQAALLRRNTIFPGVVQWSKGELSWDALLEDLSVVGNHDIMFHQLKGVIGLKLDGVVRSNVQDVFVYDIANVATAGRRSPLVQPDAQEPYDGFLARGVTVAGSESVRSEGIETANIFSTAGREMCVDLLNDFANVVISAARNSRDSTRLAAASFPRGNSGGKGHNGKKLRH